MTRAARDVAVDIMTAQARCVARRDGQEPFSRADIAHAAEDPGKLGRGLREDIAAIVKIIEEERDALRAELLGQRITGGIGGDRG